VVRSHGPQIFGPQIIPLPVRRSAVRILYPAVRLGLKSNILVSVGIASIGIMTRNRVSDTRELKNERSAKCQNTSNHSSHFRILHVFAPQFQGIYFALYTLTDFALSHFRTSHFIHARSRMLFTWCGPHQVGGATVPLFTTRHIDECVQYRI